MSTQIKDQPTLDLVVARLQELNNVMKDRIVSIEHRVSLIQPLTDGPYVHIPNPEYKEKQAVSVPVTTPPTYVEMINFELNKMKQLDDELCYILMNLEKLA